MGGVMGVIWGVANFTNLFFSGGNPGMASTCTGEGATMLELSVYIPVSTMTDG